MLQYAVRRRTLNRTGQPDWPERTGPLFVLEKSGAVKTYPLASLFRCSVEDDVATVAESMVECELSFSLPLSGLETSMANCRLEPVFTLFASPRHWATCTRSNACEIVSKLSHRSHFSVAVCQTRQRDGEEHGEIVRNQSWPLIAVPLEVCGQKRKTYKIYHLTRPYRSGNWPMSLLSLVWWPNCFCCHCCYCVSCCLCYCYHCLYSNYSHYNYCYLTKHKRPSLDHNQYRRCYCCSICSFDD